MSCSNLTLNSYYYTVFQIQTDSELIWFCWRRHNWGGFMKRISISPTVHIWTSHLKKPLHNKGHVWLHVACVGGVMHGSGWWEKRMFKGRYTCEQVVAVVGYLVSFIPDLSLSSRKPYIALMGRGDTDRGQWMKFRQKCKKKTKKNICKLFWENEFTLQKHVVYCSEITIIWLPRP